MKIGNHEVVVTSNTTAKVGCQTVTLNQIKDLESLMKNYQDFKVGDFVKLNLPSHAVHNKFGVVRALDESGHECAVAFPEKYEDFHGATKGSVPGMIVEPGFGRWFYRENLIVVGK